MAINPNIKQKANKIRNEVYGRDVRENLASGLESMSEDVVDTKQRQDTVEFTMQTVIDETTGKDVISAPEIIAAHVDSNGTAHPNLKSRLDNFEVSATQQLAETMYEKAGRDYVDAAISALGNGYIKTTFTTLAALKAAYPDGTNIGPVLVYEDYNRYIYDVNKKDWVSIGPYDPVMVEDGSVTAVKTDFLKPGKNQFNKNDTLLNQFLNYDNGTTRTLDGYSTTRYYIKVKNGQPVTLKNVRVYVLYDNNKVALFGENTGANNTVKTITPTADGYLRVTVANSVVDTAQVELGTLSTAYEPYYLLIDGLGFNASQKKMIEETAKAVMPSESKPIKVIKSGDYFFVTSQLDEVSEITVTMTKSGSRNGSFSLSDTKVNNQQIHYTGDDITPIRTNIATVGANHGYTNIIEVTMIDHGKTNSDRGSIWTDGTTEYTLLKIAGNVLTFGCPYTVGDGITQSIKVDPVANLEHVSGATNTGVITITNLASSPQLYPSINKIKVKFLLDGQELKKDGTYSGDVLNVIESYSVMDYKAIIDYAQQHIGYDFSNGNVESLVDLSNTFTFTKGLNCTTSHSLFARKKTMLGRCGFLQSGPLSLAGHSLKRFMPNVKVKSDIDFAAGVEMGEYNTSLNYQSSDYVNPSIPPNHYVDWLINSSGHKQYGFAMGYIIDKTNSKNADRLTNAPISWDMRSTKKSYPVAFEGILEQGDYLSFKGFRNYLSGIETGEATLLTEVKDAKDTYVYADFNESTVVKKELDDQLGKEAHVLQANAINLLNNIVDGNGVVIVATNISNGIVKAV